MATDRQSDSSPRARLAEAACALIAIEGVRGVTARALAERTGFSPSAMNYHFGGREALLAEAFAIACGQAEAWWEMWRAPRPASAPPEALEGWLTAALYDLCRSGGFPSLILRELTHMAARGEDHRQLATDHADRALRFWADTVAAFGLDPAAARPLADFVEGLSGVHGLERIRPEEDAWLAETCRRFAERVRGVRGPAPGWDGWRQSVLTDARREADPPPPPGSGRLLKVLEAATVVIARLGLAGLTHRAVAAEAVVSLAAVSNPFPSRSALVRATFDRLIAQLRERRAAQGQRAGARQAPRDLAAEMAAVIFGPEGEAPRSLVAEELLNHVLRDPELRRAAIDLRASRGENSMELLDRIDVADTRFDRLDAHVLSLASTGAIRAAYSRPPAERRAWLAERQANLLVVLFG